MAVTAKCTFIIIPLVLFTLRYSKSLSIRSHFIQPIRGFRIDRINNGLSETIDGVERLLSCVLQCVKVHWCLAVNFNSLAFSCQILNFDPYHFNDVIVEANTDWTVVPFPRVNKLLFRAQKNIQESTVNAWNSSEYTSSDRGGCQLLAYNPTMCNSIYRNPAIDYWDNEAYREVMMVLYSADQIVRKIVFSAQGADKMSWFSQTNLKESPWGTLDQSTPMHIFSIEGDTHPAQRRRFLVCASYATCFTDKYYLLVIDGTSPNPVCTYDNQPLYPKFFYAPQDTFESFGSFPIPFREAEVMGIFGIY